VEVDVRATDDRTVELRVRDTGPGIPAARRELIFTEGWSTKKLPSHGKRGIGLPLVRRLAERQGGSVHVGEPDGGGAEFTVVLPEALTDPGLAQDATEAPTTTTADTVADAMATPTKEDPR
jgi:two-component system CitB family sensor kinase